MIENETVCLSWGCNLVDKLELFIYLKLDLLSCLSSEAARRSPLLGSQLIPSGIDAFPKMTEGKKWCDFCKIYIANNPVGIRTHELGQRHKDNVAKRLSKMQKESAEKDKEQKEAVKALEKIEEKAKNSYQKDIKTFREAHKSISNSTALQDNAPDKSVFSASSGGKWVKQEVAFPSSKVLRTSTSAASSLSLSTSLNHRRSVKGSPSSIVVNKRKRDDAKTKDISKEEAAALRAREAARKRVEEREKPLLDAFWTVCRFPSTAFFQYLNLQMAHLRFLDANS
ncbi:hypothetical protein AXF42_Ash006668 [Apostasia shenzhenica]|uniref:Matrin-type domain-containing protein n=1 Tax=Apostasia shenzhenica TaxID=1088818 RepID=A0A2I0AJ25_9ASPA|nr:hypothetical protein AXF42_Ash006668 [Apostasia shenzhenica]